MFAPNSHTRVNIDEANKHLQMLMDRVNELEGTVKEQTEALIRKDDQTAMQLTELEREKNSEVKLLKRELKESDKNVEQLREMCRERDITIAKLRQKAAILDDILKYKPMFEKVGFHLIQAERVSMDMAKDNDDAYIVKKPSAKTTPSHTSTTTGSRQIQRLEKEREKTFNGQANNSDNSPNRSHTSTPTKNVTSAPVKQSLATDLLSGTSYGKPSSQDMLYNAFSFDGPSLNQGLQRDTGDKELYL